MNDFDVALTICDKDGWELVKLLRGGGVKIHPRSSAIEAARAIQESLAESDQGGDVLGTRQLRLNALQAMQPLLPQEA